MWGGVTPGCQVVIDQSDGQRGLDCCSLESNRDHYEIELRADVTDTDPNL